MPARRGIVLVVAALLGVPLSSSAGGGWATLTIEQLPDFIDTQRPLELSFVVRPHGGTPHSGLAPSATAVSRGEHVAATVRRGEHVAATVRRGARAGQYIATLPIDRAGEWDIALRDGYGPFPVQLLPMEALPPHGRPGREMTARERGRRLFVAKGCVTCHRHAEVPESGLVKGPPALSSGTLAAAYVRAVIEDPGIAPRTASQFRMPKLEVDAAEIEALATFLVTAAPAKANGSLR